MTTIKSPVDLRTKTLQQRLKALESRTKYRSEVMTKIKQSNKQDQQSRLQKRNQTLKETLSYLEQKQKHLRGNLNFSALVQQHDQRKRLQKSRKQTIQHNILLQLQKLNEKSILIEKRARSYRLSKLKTLSIQNQKKAQRLMTIRRQQDLRDQETLKKILPVLLQKDKKQARKKQIQLKKKEKEKTQ